MDPNQVIIVFYLQIQVVSLSSCQFIKTVIGNNTT